MAWDPTTYMQFGDHRTRPAGELLARVAVAAPARVADLGCGPGNSTALLAARWPDAALVGIDSSPEMLDDARKSGVSAQWLEADVATWTPDSPCDVVFSNATLQWIAGHKRLVPQLMDCVAPGGALAVQMPVNFGEPCHTLIREVAKGKPWEIKFENVRNWHHVLAPSDYFDLLESRAAAIDIWQTNYLQTLEGEDAVFNWMRGTGLRPFAAALEGAERDEFLSEYKAALRKAYPRRASGVTLYPFQRLFIVARARD